MIFSEEKNWFRMIGDAKDAFENAGHTVDKAPSRKRLRFLVDGYRLMTPDQLVIEADKRWG